MVIADGDKPTGIGSPIGLWVIPLITDTVLSPLFATNTVPVLGSMAIAVW